MEEKSSHRIIEGKAKIVFDGNFSTFYNPIQEFNRDLTVTVLRVFSETRIAQKNEQMEMDGTKQNELKEQTSGGLRILDALSASGLRAIRFAKEVPGVDLVVANDFSEHAFQTIQRNVQLNGLEGRVRPMHSDAIDLMMEHRRFEKRFHAIDLDPYGSAAILLDSAVQAVTDGGILMVTCTDMAILCGNCPEACFAKYGSIPIRHKSCHEMALRILLRAIDSAANRHGRFIQPLLCISIDFYIRCFVRVQSGAAKAKQSLCRLAQVFSCAQCQSLDFQPLIRKSVQGESVRFTAPHFASNLVHKFGEKEDGENATKQNGNKKSSSGECSKDEQNIGNCGKCVHCGCTAIHVGGPIYVGPIHDREFVQKMLNSLKRIPPPTNEGQPQLGTFERLEGVLTLVLEELAVDRPLSMDYSHLMATIKCPTPKVALFRSALLNGGYRCSGTHSNPNGLKTDAPMHFIWDICRAWAKQSGLNVNKLKEDSTAKRILSKKQRSRVNFTYHPDAFPPTDPIHRVGREDENNENWGPIHRFEENSSKAKKPTTLSSGKVKKMATPPKKSKKVMEEMPKTPDHYWDVDFPSPGEQVRLGYLTYATSPLFKNRNLTTAPKRRASPPRQPQQQHQQQQKTQSLPVKRRLMVDFSSETTDSWNNDEENE